jgi:hypothetical protein
MGTIGTPPKDHEADPSPPTHTTRHISGSGAPLLAALDIDSAQPLTSPGSQIAPNL